MGGVTNQSTTYRTSDLYYAAFLRVAGVVLHGVEREGRRVFFIFEWSDVINDLKKGYFNSTEKVVARSYADELRNMKTLTHMQD